MKYDMWRSYFLSLGGKADHSGSYLTVHKISNEIRSKMQIAVWLDYVSNVSLILNLVRYTQKRKCFKTSRYFAKSKTI